MKLEWDVSELTKFADELANASKLERELQHATKEIASELLKRIKIYTPIGDSWMLYNGWNGNALVATKTNKGFEVSLVNTTEYATWVNDGHRQKPGRFIPGYWVGHRFYYDRTAKGGMVLKAPFVKKRLFVEKGIFSLTNTTEIESIIMKKLQKWWDSL